MTDSFFDPIQDVIKSFSEGQIVIMTDDENRENEGDLVCAAEKVTPEIINFMITHGRGLVCVPMLESMLEKAGLSRMSSSYSADKYQTAFMDSVDVRQKTTTGISAFDRAETIKALVNDDCSSLDFVKPGHIFPLKSVPNGVLERAGHTEGTVDLARICNLKPAGVICEILNDDGSMMRLDNLKIFAKKHDLKIISVSKIKKYIENLDSNIKKEKGIIISNQIKPLRETIMPTKYGKFDLKLYKSNIDDKEHLALLVSKEKNKVPLIRVHSECMTGDVFGSKRCDCGEQLDLSMKKIQEYGYGAVIYLRQEGRGIGLSNKLHAYELQSKGLDTVEANLELGFEADERDYNYCSQILKDLGMCKINLLTNNPNKVNGLKKYGIEINEQQPIIISSSDENEFYLQTKQNKMGHALNL